MKNTNALLIALFCASLFLTVGCKKDSLTFEDDFATELTDQTADGLNENAEADELIFDSKSILVVGNTTALASELGMINALSTASNINAAATEPNLDFSAIDAEVSGVDAIFINAATEENLAANLYVQSALRLGKIIIAEDVNSASMAAIAGIGVQDAHAAIIRTKGSSQNLALTVIADELDPVFQEAVEDMTTLEDTQLSAEDIAKAKQLREEDFSEEVASRSQAPATDRFMKQHEIAGLINRGIALQDRAIAEEGPMVQARNGGFDFSVAGVDFTTISRTWTSDGQSNEIMIAFDVQMVAAVSPSYKKFLRIRLKSTSFFKPTTQKHSSWTAKGYYQDRCEVGIAYTNGGGDFELDRKAPNNPNGSSQISTSTQFGFSSNFGASTDGLNTGVGVNFSEGESESRTINDFNVYAENTNSSAKFKFHLSSHYDWRNLMDWRWTGTPIFSSRQAYVKDVPYIAKNALTPYFDVVFTAPGNYHGNKQIKVDLYHRVRRTRVTSQSWPNANWATNWYSQSYTHYFNVNFSKVSYPHMGIDQQTIISRQYHAGFNKSRAVDGFTRGANTEAATAYSTTPYIDVVLPEAYYINDIDIWNSIPYASYLNNYYVFISDTPFTSTNPEELKAQVGIDYFYHGEVSPRVKKFPVQRMGKYVRLQRADTNFLVVGEIAINPRRRGQ